MPPCSHASSRGRVDAGGMQAQEINERLGRLAADHHGVVTTRMAEDAGLHRDVLRRRAAIGMLEQVDDLTFRVAGAPVTWAQRALLACHAAGPDAVLSHRCAASAWRLDGFGQAPIELTVPRWLRRERRRNTIVHESTDLAPFDCRTHEGLPVTSPTRTLIDVAAVTGAHRLEQGIEDALRRRLCTTEELAQRFTQLARRGKRGVARLRPLLEERVGETVPTQSMLERRLVQIIDRLPIDPPVRQHPVRVPGTT